MNTFIQTHTLKTLSATITVTHIHLGLLMVYSTTATTITRGVVATSTTTNKQPTNQSAIRGKPQLHINIQHTQTDGQKDRHSFKP